MNLANLKNQTLGVIGVGLEGQAITRYLISKSLKPILIDEKEFPLWPEEIKALIEEGNLSYAAGAGALARLKDCKIIFRSPGFWRLNPLLLEAEKAGAIITSQTKWFFENSAASIIGVTGTKGKGTTTSLLHQILLEAKKHEQLPGQVYLTGNIGKEQPLDFLDSLTSKDLIAYELSSFQLQDLDLSPHIGIALMVTSDHLDKHSDLSEYHEAKRAITAYQSPNDFAIYNADYPASEAIGQAGDGVKLSISAKHKAKLGAHINGETIDIKLSNSALQIDCRGRILRGKHNLENIAAAGLAAAVLGIDQQIIEKVVREFRGLEHRLQFVATKNGISYYNDSIATVPETTIAAINSFTEPVIAIVGGSDKGIAFNSLVETLNNLANLKAVVLMGAVGQTIKQLFLKLQSQKKIIGPFQNFPDIMASVQQIAKPGDVVLLSPGTASFDMFNNYADRGHKFVEAVSKI